jgi:hypothetical protein
MAEMSFESYQVIAMLFSAVIMGVGAIIMVMNPANLMMVVAGGVITNAGVTLMVGTTCILEVKKI